MVGITPIGKLPAIVPGWAPQDCIAAYNFLTGQNWSQANPSGAITVSSSTTQYVVFADNHVQAVGPGNLPVSDLGLADWEASSNLVTSTNDMTSAAWTATNMIAALNAIGPDLVLNSATTLTATANNATIMQAIAAASSNMQASAMIKRVSGSGTVSMTVDGGVSWTPIAVGAGWSQLSIPQQTLANPSIGFKIATNGDAIAVWCAQVEPGLSGSGPTAPMPDGATTRGVLSVTIGVGAQLINAPWTLFVQTNKCNNRGYLAQIAHVGKGGSGIGFHDSSGTSISMGGGVPIIPVSPSCTLGSGNLQTGVCKRVLSIDGNVGALLAANGGTPGFASAPLSFATGPFTQLSLFPGAAIDGYVEQLVAWPYAFSSAQVQAQST